MKKNLLTLMLGFSFLLVGATISKAEVSAAFRVTPKIANKVIPEKSLSFLEGKVSFLRMVCTPMDACDNAMHGAEIAFANAVTTCDHYGYGSDNCTSSMGVADRAANVAAEKCGPATVILQAANIRKNIVIFPRKKIGGKREDTSS